MDDSCSSRHKERHTENYPPQLEEKEAQLVATRRKNSQPDKVLGQLPCDTVGLALSGGGIRSATFCLGVLQSLSRHGLLGRIDLLSTVSGGGYIGAFLGRLFSRDWVVDGSDSPEGEEYLRRLRTPVGRVQAVLKDSTSWCMSYLRDNGRYLSPNRAGDVWLGAAMFLRNWISVLFVLLTLAVAVLSGLVLLRAMLWRWDWWANAIESCLLEKTSEHFWWSPFLLPALGLLALLLVPVWSYWLTQVTWSECKTQTWRWLHERISLVTTMAIVAVCLFGVVAPWNLGLSFRSLLWWIVAVLGCQGVLALGLYALLTCVSEEQLKKEDNQTKGEEPKGTMREIVIYCIRNHLSRLLAVVLQIITVLLKKEGKQKIGEDPKRPKRKIDIYWIRNQLSRLLAVGLQITAVLLAVAFLDSLGQSTYALSFYGEGPLSPIQLLVGAGGLAAVAVFAKQLTLLFQQLPKSRRVQLPASLLAGVAGGALALVLLWAVSFSVHAVAWGGKPPLPLINGKTYNPGANLSAQLSRDEETERSLVEVGRTSVSITVKLNEDEEAQGPLVEGRHPGGRSLVVVFLGATMLSLGFGQIFAFFNLSSMHAFYAARLSRAYLGASNQKRWEKSQDKGKCCLFHTDGLRVGDPIEDDDDWWDKYTPWTAGGPLHIVNLTLNETVSGKSQIEYRDRKGLIMAVGPCGLSVGRRHHALWGKHVGLYPQGWNQRENEPQPRQDEKKDEDRFTWITPLHAKPDEFHALGLGRTAEEAALEFFNEAENPHEIVNQIHDDPGRHAGRSQAYGIRQGLAERILNERQERTKKLFRSLLEIYRVDGLGDDTRHDILYSFKGPFGKPHKCERFRLGRYVAISGAAFTTGLGSRTSLGTSLLMGLLNVRLGYWWTCGISQKERNQAGGQMSKMETTMNRWFPVQTALLSELTARFHGPILKQWYLSDGGHFENTGAYELLRRRVPFNIVCDCGCDPDYGFEDIANLTRKVRIDFDAEIIILDQGRLEQLGVPKTVRELLGTPGDFERFTGTEKSGTLPRRASTHALLAWVGYDGRRFEDRDSWMGKPKTHSYILFLKPSVSGDEPVDVIRYQSKNVDFPNESTADQFFDEAQWESYRKLGEHVSEELLSTGWPNGEMPWGLH